MPFPFPPPTPPPFAMDLYGPRPQSDYPLLEPQHHVVSAFPSLSPLPHAELAHNQVQHLQAHSHHRHIAPSPDNNASSSLVIMGYRDSAVPDHHSTCLGRDGGVVSAARTPVSNDEGWTGLIAAHSSSHGSPQLRVPVYTPPESMNSATPPSLAVDFGTDSSFPIMFNNGLLTDIASSQPLDGLQSPTSFASHSPNFGRSPHEYHYPLPPSAAASATSSPYNIKSEVSLSQPAQIRVANIAREPEVKGPDNESRSCPDLPYAQWIYKALKSKKDHTMSLKEIYDWISTHTNKGSTAGRGWQNSIRHNLSMNAAFRKQEARGPSKMGINGIGSPQKRTTNWVLEDWALEKGVQSTTRYRKTHPSRKQNHRSQHLGCSGSSGGRRGNSGGNNNVNSNYSLSSGLENAYASGLDRAAAGRRGGYATAARQSRARRQGQHDQQEHQISQPQPHMQNHQPSGIWLHDRAQECIWATPRSFHTNPEGMIGGLVDTIQTPDLAHAHYQHHQQQQQPQQQLPLQHQPPHDNHDSPLNGLFNTPEAFAGASSPVNYSMVTSHPSQMRLPPSADLSQQQHHHMLTYRPPQQQLPSLKIDRDASSQQDQSYLPANFGPTGDEAMGAWGPLDESLNARAEPVSGELKAEKASGTFFTT